MFNRFLAVFNLIVERGPELANEHPIPVCLRRSENLFQILEKVGGAQFVAFVERTGEQQAYTRTGGIQLCVLDSRIPT